ncbi:MAG: hypothetical protein JW704_08350 [Anaerolineaceae bacterium]|nr:hypothetical protein [Anaerolineaceae bacterium]MBN2677643.1 hypothetical protein [Anaerolineaceae bacterium]
MNDTKQQAISIPDTLTEYVKQGQFDFAFIADDSGLPLVCAGSNMSTSENQAAILSRIKNIIGMVDERRGLGNIDEMIFNISGNKKIICRNFIINGKRLILAITMDTNRSYRRITGTFLRKLKLIWHL